MSVRDVRLKKFPIKLDKERTLCFDLNAFADIEENYESVHKAITDLLNNRTAAARLILWAGLRHEDESLTLRQVGAMMNPADLTDIAATLLEALEDALPKAEADDTGKNQ
ncbi:MAG: hypothetical protein K6T83_10810 [Alicyclobacillus sp.]|nr:hypothetical protein [Alicyclobacillus sp.]